MTPEIYNIENQYKNDTFDGIEFKIENEITGDGVDLSNSDILIQFITGYKGSQVIKELTNSNGGGIVNTDLSDGVFTISPFLIDWDSGVYNYDIQITFPDGVVKTFVRGTVTVIEDLSKTWKK